MSPDMEMDASSAAFLRVDDLLDFSNQDIFFDSSFEASSSHHHHQTLADSSNGVRPLAGNPDTSALSSSFSDVLCVPSDDVAELEWLSQFVEDSFSDAVRFPSEGNYIPGHLISRPDASVPGRARTKRPRAAAASNGWVSPSVEPEARLLPLQEVGKSAKAGGARRRESVSVDGGVRKCTHCATEKTPQWRTGPLGPKSLCNACGVRYKSGRLVPEYRPAASPTFVLTQHSNSHRKVMELRRQKEMMLRQESSLQHDFEVC